MRRAWPRRSGGRPSEAGCRAVRSAWYRARASPRRYHAVAAGGCMLAPVISFELPPHLAELRARVRAFMDDAVIPAERIILEEDQHGTHTTLNGLRARAREH